MVVEGIKRVIAVKRAIKTKVGKKLVLGEAVTHFFYGTAVFTELHGEVTVYAIAAVTLGAFSVLGAVFGGGEE